MNFAASLCRRVNLRVLVTNVPAYAGVTDASGAGLALAFRRWATKKTAGSSKNGRDSKPKYLGVKKFGGEVKLQRVKAGLKQNKSLMALRIRWGEPVIEWKRGLQNDLGNGGLQREEHSPGLSIERLQANLDKNHVCLGGVRAVNKCAIMERLQKTQSPGDLRFKYLGLLESLFLSEAAV